jgi:hypothetical protein
MCVDQNIRFSVAEICHGFSMTGMCRCQKYCFQHGWNVSGSNKLVSACLTCVDSKQWFQHGWNGSWSQMLIPTWLAWVGFNPFCGKSLGDDDDEEEEDCLGAGYTSNLVRAICCKSHMQFGVSAIWCPTKNCYRLHVACDIASRFGACDWVHAQFLRNCRMDTESHTKSHLRLGAKKDRK